MADNFTADPGSGGVTFAGDDIASVMYPRSKIGFGPDGTYNEVESTTTNPLPVALSDTDNAVLDTIDAVLDAINAKLVSGTTIGDVNLGATDNAVLDAIAASLAGTLTVGSHAVTNAGTFAVQVDGDALTALQLIDDAVYTDATGTPSKGIAVMGTDGTNPQLISVDASGNVQVDIVSSASLTVGSHDVTNAGTFAVQAAQSGTWNITNVSGTVSLPTGASTAAKQPALGTAGAASSDVITVQGIASMTALTVDGSGVTQPVSAASLPLPSGAATSANQSTANTALSGIQTAVELLDNAVSGNEMQVDVVGSLPAGSATIGNVTVTAQATGGCSYFRSIDLDETEEEVKATAGTLYGGVVMNLKATPLYLKVYNATAANVTVGTTTPVLTIPVPSPGDTSGAGFVIPLPTCGVQFDTAITVAATTGIADNDTGAPGANECIVNLFYE